MSKRFPLKKHHNALKLLSKAKKEHYKIIVENTPDIVKAIKHLCKYILNGTIRLENKHVKKLKPHRKLIRKIATSNHKAIKTTVQRGGSILQTILNTVLPLLPALLI